MMDWQERLISLYLFVCKHYKQGLASYCLRQSRFSDLTFSDEEVLTVYLYGIIEGHRHVKDCHRLVSQYLRSWFPQLPKYAGFCHRLNQIQAAFVPLVERLCRHWPQLQGKPTWTGLVDAMPILMAQRGRRFNAKVAPELASRNGYCPSKKLYYYGVKLHVVAASLKKAMPLATCIGLTGADMHDRKAFEQILPHLPDRMTQCFADKAYQVQAKAVHKQGPINLLTPVKKAKGQSRLDAADKLLSTAISSVRQPIESFFNWLNEKTGIQTASKVRSYKGLMVHVFGRLAAALFMVRSMHA